jgi:hypothetical protein
MGLALMLGNVGLLLLGRRRPFVATVRQEAERIRAGTFEILRSDVLGVSVARGALGFSVAVVAKRNRSAFFEVSSEQEARDLVAGFGSDWPGSGDLVVKTRRESVRLLQRCLALIGLCGSTFYFVFVGLLHEVDLKPSGIAALVGIASAVLVVIDPLLRAQVTIGAHVPKGRWLRDRVARHFAIHANATVAAVAKAEPEAQHVLARGAHETAEAWLRRLDAMEAMREQPSAYRASALTDDDLRRVAVEVEDRTAGLGAARILSRRMRVSGETTGPRVVSPDVLAVEIENVEQAARRLEAMGPRFRDV